MRNIAETAFSISAAYDGPAPKGNEKPAPEVIPVMRHFHWSDIIVAETRRVAEISGLAESPLEDVSLRNVEVVSSKTGMRCENAKSVVFENISLQPDSGSALEAANVNGLEVIRLRMNEPNEGAPVVALKGVSDALFRDCRVPSGMGSFMSLLGSGNKNVVSEWNRFATGIKDRGH
jgi:hypothetical protein